MIIKDAAGLRKLVLKLRRAKAFAVDTETVGAEDAEKGNIRLSEEALILDRSRLLLVSFATSEGSWSVPTSLLHRSLMPATVVLDIISPLLSDDRVLKIMHNANYDINVFRNYGHHVSNYFCTMVASAIADENLPKGLKDRALLVNRLIRPTKTIDFSDLTTLADYAEQDALATYDLWTLYTTGKVKGQKDSKDKRRWKLNKNQRHFYRQELEVLSVFIEMERRGVKIDKKLLLKLDKKCQKRINKLLRKIFILAGRAFNVRSNKQLGEVLYDDLGIVCQKQTKTGNPSVDKQALFKVKEQHPIVPALLEYAALEKLRNTYINPDSGLLYFADSKNRIHCFFNTVGPVTFRVSASRPNLQTIPSKKDTLGIRKAFIPRSGYVFIGADYSQIELRILAIFSLDKKMLLVYNDPDGDIHQMTADECKVSRPVAKALNFGLMYGMREWALAEELTFQGIPTTEEEAAKYINSYFSTYSGVPVFRERLWNLHRSQGYVNYLTGRVRRVPHMDSSIYRERKAAERECINNVIQGSAACLLKDAMIRINNDTLLKAFRCDMLLQVHDELLFEVPEKYGLAASKRVKKLMEKSPENLIVPLRVPIIADVKIGSSWSAVH